MATSKTASGISEFYIACRNADVKFVKSYLKNLSKTEGDPIRYESSVKSTPLHTASYHGHKEIVQLLLNYDCDRSLVNEHGITAYEVAANDEIRQLYRRPTDPSGAHRFQDETTDDCFDVVKRPKERIEEPPSPSPYSDFKPKETRTVEGYKTDAEKKLEVGYATTSISMCQSKLGRFVADTFQPGSPMSIETMGNKLQKIIEEEVTAKKHPQTRKANDLLNKFLSDSDNRCAEHLIRLYTMETKFYHVLKQNPIPLALPLYMASQTMKMRYFQGKSYRGAKINDDDIAMYQWAVENPGSLLQTRHFSSTSLIRSVADEFLASATEEKDGNRRKPALFIFNFPKKCDQTINLCRISIKHPCLSEFDNEAEVLILPWTLFQVDSVMKETSSSPYIISLTNILLPHKNILSSLKWILTHWKGSVNRFQEHFPEHSSEHQSETVVEELVNNFPMTVERF